MDELRLERREDDRVIVSNSAGDEFVLVCDDSLLAEVRSVTRAQRGARPINPAEIQRLIRAGRSREEIMSQLDVDEEDVKRYEAPVLAERQYILNQAHAVPVRTSSRDEADGQQRFGEVIAERLVGISATGVSWSSWRDQEVGWMVALEFTSHEVDHRAVWSFDHRKHVLAPLNADAVTLSKQDEPGDRLIPKLRAVDHEPEPETRELYDIEADSSLPTSSGAQSSANDALFGRGYEDPEPHRDIDDDAEYERRQHIDQLAVTTADDRPDLGETQDLLRELRRRRGEREQSHHSPSPAGDTVTDAGFGGGSTPAHGDHTGKGTPEGSTDHSTHHSSANTSDSAARPSALPNLFAAPGVSGRAPSASDSASHSDEYLAFFPDSESGRDNTSAHDSAHASGIHTSDGDLRGTGTHGGDGSHTAEEQVSDSVNCQTDRQQPEQNSGSAHDRRETEVPEKKKRRGRASIPSWDDILFGTRSEDDPSS